PSCHDPLQAFSRAAAASGNQFPWLRFDANQVSHWGCAHQPGGGYAVRTGERSDLDQLSVRSFARMDTRKIVFALVLFAVSPAVFAKPLLLWCDSCTNDQKKGMALAQAVGEVVYVGDVIGRTFKA